MSEEFTKDNDYTLRIEITHQSQSNFFRGLTRIFNFKAAQVSEIYREWLTSNGAALANSMTVRNFSEIESKDEIRDMHKKLVELGGRPPAIDEVLPAPLNKKPAALRSNP
jgi:hypothetical protein